MKTRRERRTIVHRTSSHVKAGEEDFLGKGEFERSRTPWTVAYLWAREDRCRRHSLRNDSSRSARRREGLCRSTDGTGSSHCERCG